MTGQDGGFRAAAARFSAEVDAALTRARRAASEARASSAKFRKGTGELAEQAKTGRLRGVHRDEVAPTAPEARAEAAKFRNANGLPVEELPDAEALIDRLPAAEPEHAAEPDDDDFSQHLVMVDVDELDQHEEQAHDSATDDVSAEVEPSGIDSPAPAHAAAEVDDEDFSQQRILFDVTGETHAPNPFPDSVLGLTDRQNPS